MTDRQSQIIAALGVLPPEAFDVKQQARHRIDFIKQCLRNASCHTLVLGISGGVDSSTAGRLCQLAVEELRQETGQDEYRFIAVRLPYKVQKDEADAQAALQFIRADEVQTVDIFEGVQGIARQVTDLDGLADSFRDFVLGNIKARLRMVAQYAIGNAHKGLVVGTDHAAEAVMGFFTKFGDGAADLMPLDGLAKSQVRQLASFLGAPDGVVNKVPTADLEDLRPGLADEQAHGVPYDKIDAFLFGQKVPENYYQRIVATYDATRHKRELPQTPAAL